MRLKSLDAWKGIAIIAVVFIHSFGYLSTSAVGSTDWYFGIIFRQFINFAVPVFFFISGYLAFSDKYEGAISFYGKRFNRITPPYLIWSVIYICFSIAIIRKLPTIRDVIIGIVNGTSIEIGYFVIALIQLILLTPILYHIKSMRCHLFILILISIIGFAYTYCINLYKPLNTLSTFPYSAIPFIVWFLFYHTGFILRKYSPSINTKVPLCLIAMMLAASVAEAFYLNSYAGYAFSVSQLKASSIGMSLGICLLIYATLERMSAPYVLCNVGMASYGIYLSHILIMRIMYKITEVSGLVPTSKILYSFVIAIATLFAAYFMCSIIKLISKNNSKYILGY
ncbi:acyltransferase [Enterobacter hormaechei]|uniref:acyltransferase n=1 Tax=Enterobacter hormaechei TaxID=158836 RepID=UPI002DBAAC6B|nr:acyltransferase [Enterobacter hormaechei]MEB6525278.1 acyltransferase [Enterobacter hormaechei]